MDQKQLAEETLTNYGSVQSSPSLTTLTTRELQSTSTKLSTDYPTISKNLSNHNDSNNYNDLNDLIEQAKQDYRKLTKCLDDTQRDCCFANSLWGLCFSSKTNKLEDSQKRAINQLNEAIKASERLEDISPLKTAYGFLPITLTLGSNSDHLLKIIQPTLIAITQCADTPLKQYNTHVDSNKMISHLQRELQDIKEAMKRSETKNAELKEEIDAVRKQNHLLREQNKTFLNIFKQLEKKMGVKLVSNNLSNVTHTDKENISRQPIHSNKTTQPPLKTTSKPVSSIPGLDVTQVNPSPKSSEELNEALVIIHKMDASAEDRLTVNHKPDLGVSNPQSIHRSP